MNKKLKPWELERPANETLAHRRLRLSLQEGIKYSMGLKANVRVTKLWIPLSKLHVKLARKMMKASQTEFAKKIRVSPETVRKWEQGKNPIDGPAAVLISAILKKPQNASILFS